MKDYPAAHSMDTDWFAVDASGNLAMFDSGEGGAVPNSNPREWPTKARIWCLDDFLLELSENDRHRCIELKIPGAAVAKSLTSNKLQLIVEYDFKNYFLYDWLLQLSSDEAIARLGIEEIEDNYAVRFAGEPIIVYVKECLAANISKLVENGQILSGREVGDENSTSDGFASLFGLFVYVQDSGAPLPYTKTGEPIVPLCLEDLPEHLQDAISWTWFDRLEFADSNKIQPIEHMRCDTWYGDKWWIDTEGQEHEEHPNHPIW